jgi:CotS family spore coat protein
MRTTNNELLSQYDLSIKKSQYNRGNYYIDTGKDKKMIRRVNIPKEQIVFEHETIEQLIDSHFQGISPIYLTKKQLPYATYQERFYVMQEDWQGMEVDFTNKEDLIRLVELLAKFHLSARHIKSKSKDIHTTPLKNVHTHFCKRYIEGEKLKRFISKNASKTAFERMFLQGYRQYQQLEALAISQINEADCIRLIEKAKLEKTVVHGNYSYHTIYKNNQGKYFIEDMDSCGYNIQVLDLCSFFTKVMQKNEWDIKLLILLTNFYSKIKPLTLEEFKVLKSMLIFPEKYANICQSYTHSKRSANYNVFEVKWQNMLVYKETQMKAAAYIAKYL